MTVTTQQALAVFLTLAAVCESFMLGAIPWALIVGLKSYGIDLRKEGSGNLGATNVFRVLGPRAAIVVAVLDVSKGMVAVLVAWWLVPSTTYPVLHDWVLVLSTMAAMLGHSYSPYIKLRGGKGVAVAAGALLVLTPRVWPILLLIFVLVVVLTRYVSLGSITVAVAYPFLVLFFYGDQTPIVLFAFVAASLVLWRHRSNVARLVRREESKIDLKQAGQRAREIAEQARAKHPEDEG